METSEATDRLYDMHCHLGFVADGTAVRRFLREGGPTALSCTVSPAGFERDRERFADLARCRVALGLHPWGVVDGTLDEDAVRRFEALAPAAPYIGEIGLDFGGHRGDDALRARQRAVFDRILAACDEPTATLNDGGKLLSIHAVRAASEVLDMLEEHGTLRRHRCVFHWFSGTSDELKRAVEAGCSFSMGPRMLATKRGREYARIMPIEQLVLETDSPARQGDPWSCADWIDQLQSACRIIADVRGEDAHRLAASLAATSERLLTRG